ncbi:Hypothetical predicted protein [Pelobates cultripes]|uniref:Uncharacterized protein n=1 Tax=Pelobates cultripes TaxID=61616 RepID=A0AAD1SSE5_PELCU|nr:Hypothetical predicted protein [Pelobates cultripes]
MCKSFQIIPMFTKLNEGLIRAFRPRHVPEVLYRDWLPCMYACLRERNSSKPSETLLLVMRASMHLRDNQDMPNRQGDIKKRETVQIPDRLRICTSVHAWEPMTVEYLGLLWEHDDSGTL